MTGGDQSTCSDVEFLITVCFKNTGDITSRSIFFYTSRETYSHPISKSTYFMIKINSINPGHVSMFFKTKKLLQESCKYLNLRTISGCYRPLKVTF